MAHKQHKVVWRDILWREDIATYWTRTGTSKARAAGIGG